MTRAASEEMTGRARAYLWATAVFGVALGGWCVLSPSSFDSSSFAGLKETLDFLEPRPAMIAWGLVYVALGVLCGWAGHTRSEGLARAALLMACVVEACWLAGYIGSATRGQLTSPVGPMVWLVLIAKDCIALGDPMRNPFEGVARRVLAADDAPAPRP